MALTHVAHYLPGGIVTCLVVVSESQIDVDEGELAETIYTVASSIPKYIYNVRYPMLPHITSSSHTITTTAYTPLPAVLV